MATDHPITPTLKLFRKWTEYRGTDTEDQFWWRIATQAAQWGADQELEACCEWVKSKQTYWAHDELRAARRPKPPSLKKQALEELEKVDMLWDTTEFSQETLNSLDTIRRALEQLDD
jgi:hypothetical protein